MNTSKILNYLKLHVLFFLYSLVTVFGKMASSYEFLSLGFLCFLSMVFIALAIYAFFWQKTIKVFNLSVAYSNKGVTLFWGMLWGALLFDETIKVNNIIGALILVIGIYMVVTGDEK